MKPIEHDSYPALTYVAARFFEKVGPRKRADVIKVEACWGVEPPACIRCGVSENDHLPKRSAHGFESLTPRPELQYSYFEVFRLPSDYVQGDF